MRSRKKKAVITSEDPIWSIKSRSEIVAIAIPTPTTQRPNVCRDAAPRRGALYFSSIYLNLIHNSRRGSDTKFSRSRPISFCSSKLILRQSHAHSSSQPASQPASQLVSRPTEGGGGGGSSDRSRTEIKLHCTVSEDSSRSKDRRTKKGQDSAEQIGEKRSSHKTINPPFTHSSTHPPTNQPRNRPEPS